MKKNYLSCNLLEAPDLLGLNVICHQVNCQGVMGSGIAKQFREKWPVVYNDYKQFCEEKTKEHCGATYKLLGDICMVKVDDFNNTFVANLFGQNYYGRDGKRYTSYDALETALIKLKTWCMMNNKDKPVKIGFPDHMGSTLGGGNWKIVESIIDAIFEDTDFEIYICKYEK